jgi:lycopene cyclase domain-containing protein
MAAPMSYTALVIVALILAITVDLFITRARLLIERAFWVSYSILLPFQLLTNWWLTHRKIVIYSPSTILGPRVASAPIEDLGFGFALILITLTLWRRLESNHGNTR